MNQRNWIPLSIKMLNEPDVIGDLSLSDCNQVRHIDPVNVMEHCNRSTNYAVLVLNRPIKVDKVRMTSLWNRARIRVLVDGGADRWLQFMKNTVAISPEVRFAQPDLVTGDMDSISQAALQLYTSSNNATRVTHTPDQSETDYTKALQCLATETYNRQMQLDAVFTVSESSGRLDHTFANINTMFKAPDILHCIPLYHLTGDSLAWLLHPGEHEICGDGIQEQWCSLVPVGGPAAHVTTTGLKWDLSHQRLEFGKLISTSNAFANTTVTVRTDAPLVWCMGLRPER